MKNIWNALEANEFKHDPLSLRVYTSRLLGREPSLVLHGGGNTSVKIHQNDFFGEPEHVLCVKGSGWDLATIEAKGFAPVRMATLLKLANLESLSDSDMVRVQVSAMTDAQAPAPSVEAILHAIIPFQFVEHTHADAVVAITNTPRGEEAIREVYGDRVLYIPYVMPGFILARKVFELTRDVDWTRYQGMVLMNHGIFTFANDAQESYERMIRLVSEAENYLQKKNAFQIQCRETNAKEDLRVLAELRRDVSLKMGRAVIARMNQSADALHYSGLSNISSLSNRGPLTPDHVIHTKRVPVLLGDNVAENLEKLDDYEKDYREYFKRNVASQNLTCLDVAPRWAIWPGQGVISFGSTVKRADIVGDIVRHTMRAQQWAEKQGGWVALPEKDIFDVEYWELEQAKLKKGAQSLALQGRIALVTGAASGIGRSTVDALRSQGAAVLAADINPEVKTLFKGSDVLGVVCDVANRVAVDEAVSWAVRTWGGLDIVVANAGIFPSSASISSQVDEVWEKTLEINLTSQMYLFRAAAPFLILGNSPAIIVIASKNVPAPGPGAAAYSASKAGMTQLARVAALELGSKGVRVNILHPHAVMDTGLWTSEVLEGRARHYKMSVDDYKKNNLLGVEVTSKDVANLVCAMAGPLFGKTTGAQIAVDGGSDRII